MGFSRAPHSAVSTQRQLLQLCIVFLLVSGPRAPQSVVPTQRQLFQLFRFQLEGNPIGYSVIGSLRLRLQKLHAGKCFLTGYSPTQNTPIQLSILTNTTPSHPSTLPLGTASLETRMHMLLDAVATKNWAYRASGSMSHSGGTVPWKYKILGTNFQHT